MTTGMEKVTQAKIDWLVSKGLIVVKDGVEGYFLTAAGKAYLNDTKE
jgi:predicted transcriptional regulator